MTMLASLASAYARMERRGEVPPFGYTVEKIGFVISLNNVGDVVNIVDLRHGEGTRKLPRLMFVPERFKRPGIIPKPLFLWDNTGYTLGITTQEDEKEIEKARLKFEVFRDKHLRFLEDTNDVGLRAFSNFIASWKPEKFAAPQWPEQMHNQNIIFCLEDERLQQNIHDRIAARELWTRIAENWKEVPGKSLTTAVCLVTGNSATVARTHPPIKGIRSSSGKDADSIVSFNLDASESYGHSQGENAPVSEVAAAAYTATLNKFLETGSRNRVQVGDASTVFWADASNAEAAQTAEALMFAWMNEAPDQDVEAQKVGAILEKIRSGQRLETFAPDLATGVRFHVLGLAPNAARLSVRFWFEGDFGQLAENYQRFLDDMRIEPPWHKHPNPPLWLYLRETAVLGKRENVPPNLAGEWMRAILTGTRYPLTLLSTVLMRIRAGGTVNPLRAAMLKAVINCYAQNSERTITVALDPENTDPAYLLGRLFAVLERFQTLALGKVNATIRDRYFGSASATPRTVFPILIRMSQHHRSKAEKGDKPRLAGYFTGQLSEIMNLLPSDLPGTLPLREQGKFALGYFHQLNRRKDTEIAPEELTEEDAAA